MSENEPVDNEVNPFVRIGQLRQEISDLAGQYDNQQLKHDNLQKLKIKVNVLSQLRNYPEVNMFSLPLACQLLQKLTTEYEQMAGQQLELVEIEQQLNVRVEEYDKTITDYINSH